MRVRLFRRQCLPAGSPGKMQCRTAVTIRLKPLRGMAAMEAATRRGAETPTEIDFEFLEFLRNRCYLSIEIDFEEGGDAGEPRDICCFMAGQMSLVHDVYTMVSVLIKHIVTAKAPLPRGHYAQATKANGFVFVSGQLPVMDDNDKVVLAEGLDAQIRQALSNVREVLVAAGSDIRKLLSVQIYVSDIESWPRVNEIYRELIGDPAPARTVVPCGPLHYGAHVEISAIALCGDEYEPRDGGGA